MQRTTDPAVRSAAAIDIDLCAREPIHIIGTVQQHGALLVLREPDLTIQQASRSCGALLGREPEQLLGRPLAELFGAGQLSALQQGLAAPGSSPKDLNPLILVLHLGQAPRLFEGVVHRHDGHLILELACSPLDQRLLHVSFYHLVSRFITQLQSTTTLAAAAAVATEQIFQISGFDRVMIYRFDEDWNGEVIAERKQPDQEPFLGLRYPASDIPEQARRLFTLTRLRLIGDVGSQPSPIVPQHHPSTGRPLDLSHAVLRSASPVHIEYLQNMGVKASLTISILAEGALWGLIACHHSAPRTLPYQVRAACEFLGQIFSYHITSLEAREEQVQRALLREAHERIAESMRGGDLFLALARSQDSLLKLAGAGGAAICLQDRLLLLGATPTEEQTRALIGWLRQRPGAAPDLLYRSCLSAVCPLAERYKDQAAGLLALPLLQDGTGWILWFRPELLRTVDWGGDPNKPMQPDQSGRLHPRRSFTLWQQILSLHSAPFRSWEIAAAVDIRHAIVSQVAQDENRAAQEANARLTVAIGEVQAATLELGKAQRELLTAARRAGMAEIANDVLHNVGHAIHSVNVAAGLAVDRMRGSRIEALDRTMSVLEEHAHDLGSYLTQDPKGLKLAGYLRKLTEALKAEQRELLVALSRVTEGVDQIKGIVRTQQAHAGSCVIIEEVDLVEVLEDALRMSSAALLRPEVEVRRQFAVAPLVQGDKHLMLQILINLITNAKQAMDPVPAQDRVLTLRIEPSGATAVRLTVADRGVGIAPENLTRMFSQGFATRTGGRGFGLHTSALAARQMHASLSVHSDGLGKGAAFSLELPLGGAGLTQRTIVNDSQR